MKVAIVESLDHEGHGVVRDGGKVVFVEGALPRERIAYASFRKKPTYEFAQVQELLRPSYLRTTPRCRYFGTCGGCSLQHLEPDAQVAVKQRVLEDQLWHVARVKPEQLLPAVHGPAWGYRQRARFAVRYVPRKGGVLVGFHERRSSYVADMAACEVVPERLSRLIAPLRALIGGLSIRARLPQVEAAVGDAATVLVLRVLERPTPEDEAALRQFADNYGVHLYLQPGGPATAAPFHPPVEADLYYDLPEFNLRLRFGPTEFTQVNPAVNRVLVRRVVALLEPHPGERIADLFCGLGNFSLPLARAGAQVVGYEGEEALVRSALGNAQGNGLAERVRFVTADLFAVDEAWMRDQGAFTKMVIDPPRDGAIAVVKALGEEAPQRIVYVSCNPATLARDAQVLVHAKGYRLRAAGVVNMFPHTAHVESIALFERGGEE